jgi:hypothetical protein
MIRITISQPKIKGGEYGLQMYFTVMSVQRELCFVSLRKEELEKLKQACEMALIDIDKIHEV